MNLKGKSARIYTCVFFVLTAAAVLLRTLALFNDLDANGIYFGPKALINSSYAVLGASIIFYITYAFVHKKGLKLKAKFASPATFVPVTLVSTVLLFFAAYAGISLGNSGLTIKIALATKDIPYFLMLALAVLAVASIFYFLLNALIENRASQARAAFGLCAVLFFALLSAYLYFEISLPINAPSKITTQLADLFVSLFLLYEIRISLGRDSWNLYITFGFIAGATSAYAAIPNLIFTAIRGNEALSTTTVAEVLTAVAALFVISRIVLATTLEEDKKCEFIDIIRSYHEERKDYVDKKNEIEKLAYIEVYNRMSENEEIGGDPNEADMFPPIEYSEADGEFAAAESGGDDGAYQPLDYSEPITATDEPYTETDGDASDEPGVDASDEAAESDTPGGAADADTDTNGDAE